MQQRDSRSMSVDELLATYTPEQLGRAMNITRCRTNADATQQQLHAEMEGMIPREQYDYLKREHLGTFERIGEQLQQALRRESDAQSVARILRDMHRDQDRACAARYRR